MAGEAEATKAATPTTPPSHGRSGGSKKTVTLRSSDGAEFEVSVATITAASPTIKKMLEASDDVGADARAGGEAIPIPSVPGRALARVVEYCDRHYGDPSAAGSILSSFPPGQRNRWSRDLDGLDQETLCRVMLAADHLGVEDLLDLACRTAANWISDGTPEEIRERLHIVNDYTGEEEEEIRREIAWAFDDEAADVDHK